MPPADNCLAPFCAQAVGSCNRDGGAAPAADSMEVDGQPQAGRQFYVGTHALSYRRDHMEVRLRAMLGRCYVRSLLRPLLSCYACGPAIELPHQELTALMLLCEAAWECIGMARLERVFRSFSPVVAPTRPKVRVAPGGISSHTDAACNRAY